MPPRNAVRPLTLAILTSVLVLTTTTTRVATQGPTYGIVDVGALPGGTSTALAMDYAAYEVVGSSQAASTARHAFYTNPYIALMRDLGTLGGVESEATAIESGWVVGSAQTASGVYHAFRAPANTPLVDLGTLGGAVSWAFGVNATGIVVGASTTASGGRRAFIYRDNAMSEVTLGSTLYESEARDINNNDQVVGWLKPTQSSPARAFLWQNGIRTDLGAFASGAASTATAISDLGVVVGYGDADAAGTVSRAFRWQNGVFQGLPTLAGSAAALAVNNDGTIAGWSINAQGQKRAVIWRDGQVFDLNTLIKPGSGWVLESAHGIGHRDAVVGHARKNNVPRAFLAVPPIDLELSAQRNPQEIDPNVTNPHEAGTLMTWSASVFNNSQDFPATNVVIRDTLSGPVEYVDWFDADCVKEGQTLTCKLRTFEIVGAGVIFRVRATAPGLISHSATIVSSDQVDATPSNNSDGQSNTAVSLASLTLAQSVATGGQQVLGRATLTSVTPPGGARVTLTSSHPDIASVPSDFDVLQGANNDIYREFYVTTKPVSAPVTVQISARYGLHTHTRSLTINPSGAVASTPFRGTPHGVPGIIQAEDFDAGGANVAYFDTTAANIGGQYRTDASVDIERTTDAGTGHNVGWMAASEWLQYTVNVATPGSYRLDLRVAAAGAGGRVHVKFDGVDKTGPLTIPNTGGWQNWTNIGANVTLAAGTQKMRVFVDAASAAGIVGNLNHIDLRALSAGPQSTPFSGTPSAIPGIIQAENFDKGGANVAYVDATAGNTGGAYRQTEDVDIQLTSDSGAGHNVGWMSAGEWLVYSVNVSTAGSYRLDLRVAAGGAGGRLRVEFNGVDKTGPLTIPNTGGWQTWRTISAPVTLSAGPQRMRVVVEAASSTGIVGNLNFIQVVAPTPTPTTPTDIVIYASDVGPAALHGLWSTGPDAGSPSQIKLQTSNEGFSATAAALASPLHYVDITFTPVANTPYALWLRLKALDDNKFNDAVWVQFSGAQVNGSTVFPINSSSGLLVNLATNGEGTSLANWGWTNGAYWLAQPKTFTFPSAGTQTLRIQTREDGVQIDQIVLSPKTYLSAAPGVPTNDTRIVAKP